MAIGNVSNSRILFRAYESSHQCRRPPSPLIPKESRRPGDHDAAAESMTGDGMGSGNSSTPPPTGGPSDHQWREGEPSPMLEKHPSGTAPRRLPHDQRPPPVGHQSRDRRPPILAQDSILADQRAQVPVRLDT